MQGSLVDPAAAEVTGSWWTMSSAAELVEGGMQDRSDDSCSICLEPFGIQDPASVTNCNHGYHLQCILEWVQRSSECPMCWQPLLMKDAAKQALVSSAEQERSLRLNQSQAYLPLQLRSDYFDLDHYASFEERLMQHLTAASARQVYGQWRRNRFDHRPTLTEHPGQVINFSTHTAAASATLGVLESGSDGQLTNSNTQSSIAIGATRFGHMNGSDSPAPRRASTGQRALSSDFQSFSESIKSRLTAASSKYRETFAKTARIFREKMKARNVSKPDRRLQSRDVSTGVVQALGQISLESACSRTNRDEAHPFSTVKEVCILDKQ